MITIEQVRRLLSNEHFTISLHATTRALERKISIKEIIQLAQTLELIEFYPDDKYLPSGLFLGFTNLGRPLHIQLTLNSSITTKIITIYEPEIEKWKDNFTRRRNES